MSKAVIGSSRRMTGDSVTRALAMYMRCCSPRESSVMVLCLNFHASTVSIAFRMISVLTILSLCGYRPIATRSYVEKSKDTVGFCGTREIILLICCRQQLWRFSSFHNTSPDDGVMIFATAFKNVDFPAPLGPMIAYRVPWENDTDV